MARQVRGSVGNVREGSVDQIEEIEDHPDVADTYNNMAYTNQGRGSVGNVLSIRLKKLGDDHPDVADTYNNMANSIQESRQVRGSVGNVREGSVDQIEEIRRRPS